MDELAEELRRSLRARLKYLSTFLEELLGSLGPGRQGVRDAIRLASFYPAWIQTFADRQWRTAPGPIERVDLLRSLLVLLGKRAQFCEDVFSRAQTERVPLSLIRAVERACEELGLGRRKPVLALGSAGNYETFVGDLVAYLYSDIQPTQPLPRDLPKDLRKSRFALILIPRFEGGEALWRPVVLGHELAHLRIHAKRVMAAFNVEGRIDWTRMLATGPHSFPRSVGLTPRLALGQIARDWAEELLCDAYAVRRFGPAGVGALSEFLDVAGMTDYVSYTHPPGWLRVRLMTAWVGNPASARLQGILGPWRQLAGSPRPAFEPWADALVDELEQIGNGYVAALNDWPPEYPTDQRTPTIEAGADALRMGLPTSAIFVGEPKRQPFAQDAINSGWVGRVEAYDTPIESLVGKSLGDVEFVRLWRAHGGEVLDRNRPAVEAINGVLSTVAIVERLRRAGPGRLVITPLLEPSLGVAGVDLRLGATFITFSRSGTASFDPLNESDDPRTMQFAIEKEWGEPFILHPGELVLAATLEYMALPDDLSAQVITRSSYGRLGLITATAIQVHPHFKGCLTLELVNLGEVPIELIPGERIAQLTFATVSPPAAEAKGKYSYPVGPEFSRVRTDAEATVLRRLRHEARHRYEATSVKLV